MDDGFLQEFYHAMVEGNESEKSAYRKKVPRALTLEEIKGLLKSGANVTDAIESRSREIRRYLEAYAALIIDYADRRGVEPPTYEAFKKHHDYVIKHFDDIKPEIEELKKRCGENADMFNYLLFKELLPKGENTERMFG